MMKVLMTAYACEPEKGSEPGVGWGWSNGLAAHVDLTVVTRANNQELIESWYQQNDPEGEVRRPHFEYYDPPKWALWLKRKKILPVQFFFAIWKAGVALKYRSRLADFDLIHQLTYGSIVFPGLWWRSPKPVVLGPIGGTSTVSENYISLYGNRIWKERIRAFVIHHWDLLPWARLSFHRADLIACSNSEANAILSECYPQKTRTMTEIGAELERVNTGSLPAHSGTDLKLVWIGMVEPWKAWSIAIEAVKRANDELGDRGTVHLTMLGQGNEEPQAHSLATALGIENQVTFLQRIPLDDLHRLIESAHVFVFSSVKDTSGTVVLEGMGHGKALICINHQGVGDMTTEETAIRVEPGSLEKTIEGFGSAMVKMALDPEMRERMCLASRDRVLSHYVWGVKAKKFYGFYEEVVARARLKEDRLNQ